MFVTRNKNAVLARTLRPVALGVVILCFGVTSGLSGVSPASAAESSHPETLPNGSSNLTEIWMRSGGARLYWNTLTHPRQIRMVGAAFADPAAVPELMSSPQGQPDMKSPGKGSRGGKTAPHSVVVDPRAPVRSWPHAASRPAKQGGVTAGQAGKTSEAAQAARAPAEKPASVSPALTAPSSARQGNGAAAAAAPSSAPGKSGTNSTVPNNGGKAREGAAYPSPSPSMGIGNGVAAPAGAALPSGASSAATPTTASSSASTSSMSVTGTGAAAGAFGKAGVGSVRSSSGGAQADVPIPPPIPSLSADDLLPPSNGAGGSSGGGGASVRAPLP